MAERGGEDVVHRGEEATGGDGLVPDLCPAITDSAVVVAATVPVAAV